MSLQSKIRNLLVAVLTIVPMLILPVAPANAGVFVSINIAPPVLPVYQQPPLPAPGYLWTPGYWAYGDAGYFWVPGVWVQPPSAGLLWTPGYWGYAGGVYGWHGGYWGPHIGFYGGVNYGYGYGGVGFVGGEWRGGVFAYNLHELKISQWRCSFPTFWLFALSRRRIFCLSR
jgi:WXXGXW repeat (2 copies)